MTAYNAPNGATSDTYDDTDGVTTDELGDPLWSDQSGLIKSAERIRRSETRATMEYPSHYEVKQSGLNRKWFISRDGKMLTENDQPKYFKSRAAAETFVTHLVAEDTANEKIEHKAEKGE